MNCIVTAGPTCEPLDQVRRLTNFSTGRLGIELANFLQARGCDVTLLAARDASWPGERRAGRVEHFVTSADLREALETLAGDGVNAVFHAAAVSDFKFGKIFVRSREGQLTPVKAGKISTGTGTLLAELLPAPKIIGGLRDWFPKARIVGWKFEVDGNRAAALAAAAKQISECLTDACVANGPAYGEGFGLVHSNGGKAHLADSAALFEALFRSAK
ncbi:MAG TPA: phosphopantothenoylcysteine decarboxylase [Verrucomicrobiae bacterium]|nr:phosphopantothenoylcysteine decarboxylase [Verrucomicrobiae bacterium]